MRHRIMPRRLSGIFWILSLVLVALVALRLQNEASSFLGIADASENVVSSETSAEVLSVSTVPGQTVQVGDTLVRLRRPDLEMRINENARQLQGALRSEAHSDLDVGRLSAQVRSDLEGRRTAIAAQIRSLEEERGRNRDLVSHIRGGTNTEVADSATDPILLRIQGLHRQIQTEEQGAAAQLLVLRGGGGLQKGASQDLQEALVKERELLQAEKDRLVICASIPGVVGSVNVRAGEKVAPFAPILTLSPRNPTLVRGYIHEKVYDDVAVGDSVDVRSSGARSGIVRGRVVGVGSRIVEFPLRLRKMPQIEVWGREVAVRIPTANPFLLGEMVSVHRLPGKILP